VRTFTIASASVDFVRGNDEFWTAVPSPERSTDCTITNVCAFDPDASICD
jgi:hypothetical protein